MSNIRLNLVVAICNGRGIGINGQLPWRIRGDMAFFKKITSETKNADKKNAVIMGRKTWESIPEKFRPLPNRINIIISRNMTFAPEGALLAGSLEKAVDLLTSTSLSDQIENIFVIGGSSIYDLALSSKYHIRIYLTTIMADYECDTFLPEFEQSKFKVISDPAVDSSEQTDDKSGVKYKFEVLEQVRQEAMSGRPQVAIMVAMCNNRGIARDRDLPWPSMSKDYEYYLRKTSERTDPEKKVVRIKGRLTWEDTGPEERSQPGCMTIIVSNTLTDCPEQVDHLAKSVSEAVELATDSHMSHQVERVWVMGGQKIFEDAIKHNFVNRIYVTRILADYEADRFFPPFHQDFKLTSEPDVNSEEQEENGVKFKFEVYERITS